MPTTAKVARVAVSEEQWRAFRQAALTQGISVSTYLARLVEAELVRRRGRPVAAVDPEAPHADQGISASCRGSRLDRRARQDRRAVGARRRGSRCVVGGRRQLVQARRGEGESGLPALSRRLTVDGCAAAPKAGPVIRGARSAGP